MIWKEGWIESMVNGVHIETMDFKTISGSDERDEALRLYSTRRRFKYCQIIGNLLYLFYIFQNGLYLFFFSKELTRPFV